jgi:hypothetical protein
MCISIKITTNLTFAHILQKNFDLSNEFVISEYYLYLSKRSVFGFNDMVRYKREFVITGSVINGFNCI